jgi:TolB-like protein/Tfp pilus assembly protein PilF
MISARKLCPKCGTEIPSDAPEGGCTFCLLQAAIGSQEEIVHDSIPDAVEGGMRFGVYEIDCHADGSLCELGRGAMGVTYRATDTTLQRKVALKIIKTDLAERSADARERFMREARAAAALRHESIATVHQFGMSLETGQYFYAMELIEGETLEDRVRRAGPLDARTTIEIGQQVTSALAAAEKHGLVHRDLKPSNLMLVSPDIETRNNKKLLVKIIDFGLAKTIHTPTDPKSLTHDRFVGTPAFASPEQFEHSALDVRSDIYSLGETLWFALTGKTPFAGRSVEEIHRAQKSNVLRIEQLKAAHVPHRLRSLLQSMLAFEPASRPGTHELAARLQRCSSEARSVRRTRVTLAAAAVLILGASAAIILLWERTQNSIPKLEAPEKSIAVLPFENLSRDPDSAYFADGVQDEILTDLAQIADLKVISRTSTMQYKSGVARNLREIGRQLAVAHVVEGSVQRAGKRVRVNAQLVDASTDQHLWAETYDRDLADVFAIQSEIAKAIATQLQAKLLPREERVIEQIPTTDVVAFDLYTRAKFLILAASGSSDGRTDLLEAVNLLNQAIAHDPSFLQAYCQLASAHNYLYFLGLERTSAHLELANAAIQEAFRLRPDAGEAHLARAENLYRGYLDYEGALNELKVAGESLPNDARLFELKGYILRRQGIWEGATRNLERAVELDPLNADTLEQLAWQYMFLRRYGEVKALLKRVLAVEPNRAVTKVFLASVDFHWTADIRPFHQMIDSIRRTDPTAVPSIDESWLICALAERDPNAVASAMSVTGDNAFGDETVQFTRNFLKGVIARMLNDEGKARVAFTAARAEQEKSIGTSPSDAGALCVLGLIDAALGQKEDALREGRRAMALVPVEKDAIVGTRLLVSSAMIAAWAGDKDLACEQLANALRHPGSLSYGDLKLSPFWDPLRGYPRFEEIVASLAPKKGVLDKR